LTFKRRLLAAMAPQDRTASLNNQGNPLLTALRAHSQQNISFF